MSLYTLGEICDGCENAVLYECGNCLKECKIDATNKDSGIDGSCRAYKLEGGVIIKNGNINRYYHWSNFVWCEK